MIDGYDAENVFSLSKIRKFKDQRSEEKKIEDALNKQRAERDADQPVEETDLPRENIHPEAELLALEIMGFMSNRMQEESLHLDHPGLWAIKDELFSMLNVCFHVRDQEIAQDLLTDPGSDNNGWIDFVDDD